MVPYRRIIKTALLFLLIGFCMMQFYTWSRKERPTESSSGVLTSLNRRRGTIKKEAGGRVSRPKEKEPTTERKINIDAEMSNRVQYLQKQCRKIKPEEATRELYDDAYLSHLIVNEQKKLMYCYVPKIANTNFRRILISLSENINSNQAKTINGGDVYHVYKDSLKTLDQYKPNERKSMKKSYKKFLFVREPLERLLSAYRNKYFHPNQKEAAPYYRHIEQFYAAHSILNSVRNITVDLKTRTISFSDFLTFWTDAYETGTKLNEHFLLVSDLCQPCGIKYDYIGKFEYLQRDSDFVLSKFGIDTQFPPRNDNYSDIETADIVKKFYKQVPKHILKRVRNILRVDFRLFDYKIPEWFA